ncbi:MAG: hypothetical protein ACT4NY_14720 [Pseudonocardiales bacterium]
MTSFIAASATGSNFVGANFVAWATLAAMLWVAWHLLVSAVFPWRACRWCEGGKKRSSSGRHWRDCRHCTGTGKRIRAGRRLWKAMAARQRGRH